jgi:hypothetical protein
METKRKMPSKKQIFNHWENKLTGSEDLNLNTCWSCGFEGRIERCHLHDRCYSFNDDVSNLVLLCKECHKLQESMCQTEINRLEFINKIKQGPFLMSFKINSMLMKVKYGIYDSVISDLGYKKEQIEKVKLLITY